MFLRGPSVSVVHPFVPVPEGSLSREIGHVGPPSARELRPDQRFGGLFRRPVIVFVPRGMIGVQKKMPHGRGSGRLDPHHRGLRLQFAPDAGKIGGVVPEVTAPVTHFFDQKGRRLFHGGQHPAVQRGLVLFRGGNPSRNGQQNRQSQRPNAHFLNTSYHFLKFGYPFIRD